MLIHNLLQVEKVALVTVTAPGQDAGLAWDRSQCDHPPEERCSGLKGCRVVKRAADRWNRDRAERWALLHRAAAARARRRVGSGPIVAAKAWEPQARGVGHLHLVVPYGTPRERARADVYVRSLKELAGRHWFGFVDMKRPGETEHAGISAAIYVGKYVSKAATEETCARPVYVGQFLTRQTGVTMRAMRWRRYLWRRFGERFDGVELRAMILLVQAFPDLELIRDGEEQPNAPPSSLPSPANV